MFFRLSLVATFFIFSEHSFANLLKLCPTVEGRVSGKADEVLRSIKPGRYKVAEAFLVSQNRPVSPPLNPKYDVDRFMDVVRIEGPNNTVLAFKYNHFGDTFPVYEKISAQSYENYGFRMSTLGFIMVAMIFPTRARVEYEVKATDTEVRNVGRWTKGFFYKGTEVHRTIEVPDDGSGRLILTVQNDLSTGHRSIIPDKKEINIIRYTLEPVKTYP